MYMWASCCRGLEWFPIIFVQTSQYRDDTCHINLPSAYLCLMFSVLAEYLFH